MSIPENESIQESLDRLTEAQSERAPTEAGLAHARTVRDAKRLRRVTLGFCLGFLAAFLAIIVASVVEPHPKDFNWLGCVFVLGCAAMIATFLVHAAWMIVDFPRWRRAVRGYVPGPPAQDFGPRSAPLGGWQMGFRRQFLFCAADGVHYRRWYWREERVIPWQDVAGAFTDMAVGEGGTVYGVKILMTGGGTRVKNMCVTLSCNTARDAVDTIEAWREYYGPRVPATRERSDGDAS
ncbi:hypothetical protein [Longivirga aurantiaca]|uniref:Uncharacterized protein n=1 Tax=Longivirga aurantiaca TaxID=1837743 RepID=A0ABW1T0R3_9ACTN